jgi:hypothetical protein
MLRTTIVRQELLNGCIREYDKFQMFQTPFDWFIITLAGGTRQADSTSIIYDQLLNDKWL